MRTSFIVLLLGVAAAGGENEASKPAGTLTIKRVCLPAFKFFEAAGVSDAEAFQGFAERLGGYGEMRDHGSFEANLEAYLVSPLPEVLQLEPIAELAELRRLYQEQAESLIGSSKGKVDWSELAESTAELFLRHFLARACTVPQFDLDFLNAADAAAKKLGDSLTENQHVFEEEYNQSKEYMRQQLSDLVVDESDFICNCRGLNGLGQLSTVLHRTVNLARKGTLQLDADYATLARRYIVALALIEKSVPAESLALSPFEEHFGKVGEHFKATFDKPPQPLFLPFLATLMKESLLHLEGAGQRALAHDLARRFMRDFALRKFARMKNAYFDSYMQAYFEGTTDFALAEPSAQPRWRLDQLKVLEFFAAGLQATEQQTERVVAALDALLELDTELLASWRAGFLLHSSYLFELNGKVDEPLLRQCHDLIDAYVVERRPATEPHAFGQQFDKYLDELLAGDAPEKPVAFFLKFLNGFAIFSQFPETDYQMRFAVLEGETAKFSARLEREWNFGGVIGEVEELAAQNQRRVRASLFAEYINFSEEVVHDNSGRGRAHQYNKIGGEGFEVAVAGQLDRLQIDKKALDNGSRDVSELAPREVEHTVTVHTIDAECRTGSAERRVSAPQGAQVAAEQFELAGAHGPEPISKERYEELVRECNNPRMVAVTLKLLAEDCGVSEKKSSRKATDKYEPTEVTLYARAGSEDATLSREEFDRLLSECLNPATYEYRTSVLRDCEEREESEKSTRRPEHYGELQKFVLWREGGAQTVEEAVFREEARKCAKLKSARVTQHLLHTLRGRLAEERLQAIRQSPDLLAYFTNSAPTEEVVAGVPVEFAYVLINREASPCFKPSFA